MYVYYATDAEANGRIYYCVKDYEEPYFKPATNRPLEVIHIDDTPETKDLRIDMLKLQRPGIIDEAGDPKYSIDTKTNTVAEKPGWEQKPAPEPPDVTAAATGAVERER